MSNFESLSVISQKYCCPMTFGVAMDSDKLTTDTNKDKYAKIIPYVFDSITCENNMKPDSIRTDSVATTANYTTETSYDYSNADVVFNFAKTHNMKMLGNVLWYDSNVPKFVTDLDSSGNLTSNIMSNIFNSHISTVISHFDSNSPYIIYNWQVANEALDPNGTPKAGNIGQRIMGDSYFSNLFKYANSSLITLPSYTLSNPDNLDKPNAYIRLFYNDTDVLSNNDIFNTLKDLKDHSLLHGIGLQCHSYNTDIIDAITLKYIKERFEVHFTEVDFPTPNPNDNDTSEQVKWFTDIIKIALKYGVTNFTVWGLTDDKSWLNSIGGVTQYPLLFDSNFQAKNCYHALIREMTAFSKQKYDIFIIIGQSNAAGRASQEYTFDKPSGGTYDMKNNPFYFDDFNNEFNENIRAFSYNNRIIPAFDTLDHLEGVHTPRLGPKNNYLYYGFGLSFARQYVKERPDSGRKVLLIGCAWGGTGFFSGDWLRDASGGKLLYKKSLKKIQTALDAYPDSEVKGILWHQGEADSGTIFNPAATADPPVFRNYPNTNLYKNKLTTMLNSLRANISRPNKPTIPILMGGLCPSNYIVHYYGPDKRSDGKQIQHRNMTRFIEQIAKDNSLDNYKFVSAEPISSVPDFNHYLKGDAVRKAIHFNKSSIIEFGKRYFYVFNNNHINSDKPFT